nr:hypothetical protein [Micromonospora sp. DSM 115978]
MFSVPPAVSAPPAAPTSRPSSAPPTAVETPPHFRALPSSYDRPGAGPRYGGGEPAETEPELGAPSPAGPGAWSSGWAPPWASTGSDAAPEPGRLRDDWSPSWSSAPAGTDQPRTDDGPAADDQPAVARSTPDAADSSARSDLGDPAGPGPGVERPIRPAWADAPAAYNRSARARTDETPPARAPWQPIAPTYATGGEPPSYQPAEFSRAYPPTPSQPGYPYRPVEPDAEAPAPVGRSTDPLTEALPQRVPAVPDVPTVPEPPAVEPPAETPELARIATHLRREDGGAEVQERPEGFDVRAILAAVRGVDGVRDASLRTTPAGAHSLRLDLADGADPAEVSRHVARLLQERMGLAAAPQDLSDPPAAVPPPAQTAPARTTPAQTAPARTAPTAPGGVSAAALRTVPDPTTPAATGQSATSPAATGQSATGQSATGQSATGRETTAAEATARGTTASGTTSLAGPGTEVPADVPRRRRAGTGPQGRATVDERLGEPATLTPLPAGPGPQTAGTSYSGGQITTTEAAPSRPLPAGQTPGPRVVIDHVQVSTFGLDATVEVRLAAGEQQATGLATGPAVDGYVLRLCAVSAAAAVDELLRSSAQVTGKGRCFVEHAAVVPFGSCEVATVVVLLVCDGWVEQLAGSALVAGDPRQAVVRATLAAVNRRLEALLA